MTSEATPRSPLAADVAGLIGLLAVLEGEVMISPDRDVLPDWAAHLARRLASDGLLDGPLTSRTLRQALNDLNHRLRYVAGEYDAPPQGLVVP